MKIIVCKGCGQVMYELNTETGKLACTACIGLSPNSGIPIEVETPDTIACDTCHKKWTVSDILKQWKRIPFYNARTKTFYDGCRGFD